MTSRDAVPRRSRGGGDTKTERSQAYESKQWDLSTWTTIVGGIHSYRCLEGIEAGQATKRCASSIEHSSQTAQTRWGSADRLDGPINYRYSRRYSICFPRPLIISNPPVITPDGPVNRTPLHLCSFVGELLNITPANTVTWETPRPTHSNTTKRPRMPSAHDLGPVIPGCGA